MNAQTLKKSVLALAIAATLGLSGGMLVGCGGGSADTAADTTTDSSSSTDSSSNSSSSSDSSASSSDEMSLKDLESEMSEAYMGVTEANEGFYYAGNADGSLAILVVLNDAGESVSFVGPAETQGNQVRVTDMVSGNTLTFSVEPQSDGTMLFDMGDTGKALVASCPPSEVLSIMEQIDTYSKALA